MLHILGKKRRFSGETALMYCVWYGFGRAIIETVRTDSLMLGNIKVSFLVSLLICIGSLVAVILINKKMKTAKTDTTYNEMFKDELAAEFSDVYNEETKVEEE